MGSALGLDVQEKQVPILEPFHLLLSCVSRALVAPWEAASAMRLGGIAGYLKGPWGLVVL
jgi:hypothetical protein